MPEFKTFLKKRMEELLLFDSVEASSFRNRHHMILISFTWLTATAVLGQPQSLMDNSSHMFCFAKTRLPRASAL